MAFRVGDQVVCVDASRGRATGHRDLVFGRIYVVDGIDPEATNTSLYLVGVPRRNQPDTQWSHPIGWASSRFRPLVTRKTDISALKALLEPVRERV